MLCDWLGRKCGLGGLSLTESGGEWGDAMYRVEEWHRVSGRWWDVSGRGPRGRFALIDKGGARVGGGVEMDSSKK